MNILILSTSPRIKSLTLRSATYLKMVFATLVPEAEVSVLDFSESDLTPLGRGSFTVQPPSPFQEKLLGRWKEADLIIFCSPEYNWTASAETFILLERMGTRSFREYFDNKVFAVAGISSGRGGRQPALDISRVLSKIIGFLETESLVSPRFLEIHEAGINLDEDSVSRGNPAFEQSIHSFCRYGLLITGRWKKSDYEN